MLSRRPRLSFLLLPLLVATSACSSGSSGGNGGGAPSPQLITDVRTALTNEGVGPLPAPPVVRDELFELGQALFFDKLLSGNLDVSCSTCHLPGEGGSDGRTLPSGVDGFGLGPLRGGGEVIPRNSPTTLNVHLFDELFWDGRVQVGMGGGIENPAGAALTPAMQAVFEPGLEIMAAQAMFPPTSRDEMRGKVGENELGDLADGDFAAIWEGLTDRLVMNPTYVGLFAAAYPGVDPMDLTFAHAANAIAGFEARAFGVFDSPFERFVNGDDAALTQAQLEGALEFYGRGNCAVCHSGNTFSDGRFHNIALPQFGPGKGSGVGGDDDFGRELVTGAAGDRYAFRTTPLLNVELTAPYGHAGQYATLRGIVEHYRDAEFFLQNYDVALQVDDPALIPTLVANEADVLANISPRLVNPRNFDIDAIVTFLEALTADGARDLSAVVPASVPSGLSIDG